VSQEPAPAPPKGRPAVALTPPARQVHLAVLQAFADAGQAPRRADLERIARCEDAEPGAVLAELTEQDMIAVDDRGEIRAAYPFSPSPTRIQVTWPGGPAVHAMCAIDALGMSAMLDRPVTITAREPDSCRVVTVTADRDQARWTPRTAVVFAGAAGDACWASIDRCCGYINFFTSVRAARRWAARNPHVTGTTLKRAAALSHGIAEFGTLMR
jgi:Alkylmercury lyase